MLVFALLVAALGWSGYAKMSGANEPPAIGATKDPVGSHDGVRKLVPDFTVCGDGDINAPSRDGRNPCSRIVREATIKAQTECSAYIQNEADCRQERGSKCDIHMANMEGCQRLVVLAALAKAPYVSIDRSLKPPKAKVP